MTGRTRPIVELAEWQRATLPGATLENGEDRRLAASLRDTRRIEVDELRDGLRVMIDVKYKLIDAGGLAAGDIYQCMMYALAYAAPESDAAAPVLLIFPSADDAAAGPRLHVRRSGGNGQPLVELRSLGVPLARLLAHRIIVHPLVSWRLPPTPDSRQLLGCRISRSSG